MRLRRWEKSCSDKHIKVKWRSKDKNNFKKNGGDNMEMVRTRNSNNTYVKPDRKKVLDAINKCNKKYEKAMKELSK